MNSFNDCFLFLLCFVRFPGVASPFFSLGIFFNPILNHDFYLYWQKDSTCFFFFAIISVFLVFSPSCALTVIFCNGTFCCMFLNRSKYRFSDFWGLHSQLSKMCMWSMPLLADVIALCPVSVGVKNFHWLWCKLLFIVVLYVESMYCLFWFHYFLFVVSHEHLLLVLSTY